MYAAGKIPGGFIKREGRMSEAATLAARLTDRPIRPLFPEGYKDDVQLVITVLSTDQENDPDILGTIAASAALTISEIPFQGPVGAVRVGRIDGEFVLNPTYTELQESELDLVVSGTRDAIMMVEAGRQDPPRGRDGRGDPVRPARAPAARRDPGQAPRARRQAQAPAVPRAAHGLRAQVRRPGEGGRRVRRRGRRDDRHRSQDGRPRRGRRGARQGRQDHRPLVHAREPGPPDRRQPDARHHRQGRQGRPEPGRGRPQGARLRRRRAVRRPLRRLRHRLHRGGPRGRHPRRPGLVPRHARHRPRGLPGPRELQARDPGQVLRRRAVREPPRPAGRRGDREPADLVRQRPARPHRDPQGRRRRRDPRDPLRQGRGRAPARGRPPRGTLQQEPVRARPEEGRPPARAHRGHPHGRPRHRRDPPDLGRGGPPPARARLRPVHPRPDPGADRRHARARPRTSSGSTPSAPRL